MMPLLFAKTNLDFRLDVERKGFYPNEKIPLDITVVNRDTVFSAKEAKLAIQAGERSYIFELGDLRPGSSFKKEIVLPEFPAGTQILKGNITYSGTLEEKFLEVTYGSFEVLYPPIERYPRNVYVSDYNIPEKIIGGKTYDTSVTVTNDGEVKANILIEVGTTDESESSETTLEPGQSTTVKLMVKFDNPGISPIEARVYALINGEKYLLNYRGKGVFIHPESKAKLGFDRVELVEESDNKINQNDKVKFKVFIKNEGSTATDVNGYLSSSMEQISILDSDVNYGSIVEGDYSAPQDDFYEIETKSIEVGAYTLNLKLNYVDEEGKSIEIEVPIDIATGDNPEKNGNENIECKEDNQCTENQICENNKCLEITCENGFIRNHQCIKYECVVDSNCQQGYTCDTKLHICLSPQCVNDLECANDEVCSLGKCKKAFTLVFVPVGFNGNEFENFRSKANIALNDIQTKTPFKTCQEKIIRAHYIRPENCPIVSCQNHCGDCIDSARQCVFDNGLGGIYDKFAALSKIGGGGCAGNIPNDGSSTNADHPQIVIHEFGHDIGLCHVPLCGAKCAFFGEPQTCSWCPNYQDILNPSQEDIMSYCSKDQYFGNTAYQYLTNSYDGISPKAGGLAKWLNAC